MPRRDLERAFMRRSLFSAVSLSRQILHKSSTAPSHIDFHWLVVFDEGRVRVAEVGVQLPVAAPSIVLVVRSGCGFFAPVSPARPGTKNTKEQTQCHG